MRDEQLITFQNAPNQRNSSQNDLGKTWCSIWIRTKKLVWTIKYPKLKNYKICTLFLVGKQNSFTDKSCSRLHQLWTSEVSSYLKLQHYKQAKSHPTFLAGCIFELNCRKRIMWYQWSSPKTELGHNKFWTSRTNNIPNRGCRSRVPLQYCGRV